MLSLVPHVNDDIQDRHINILWHVCVFYIQGCEKWHSAARHFALQDSVASVIAGTLHI